MVLELSLVLTVLIVNIETKAIEHSFFESRMVLDLGRDVVISKVSVIPSKMKL